MTNAFATLFALLIIATLFLAGGVNANACCLGDCPPEDAQCRPTCGIRVGVNTCYPRPTCDPSACHLEDQENTLKPKALGDQTSKAKVVVKKDDDIQA